MIHPRRKQAITAFASGTMVIVDLNCPSNVRAAPRSSSRNLNSTFGVGRWAFLIPDLRLRFAAFRLRARLVSLNWLLLCGKEGRCEIPPRGCSLDLNQRACRSLIRACPWMVFKLEQLLERPGCFPGETNSLASSHLQAGVIYL